MWGFVLGIVGSLLVGIAPVGALALPLLMLGRICQGLSAAFIMPASLALVKTYWDGAARQRAVSLWSMGSWGGSGFAALFGGVVTENVGWRWIFFASAAVSALGMLMVRGTPESKAAADQEYRFDTMGVLTFMVTMVALQILATQGSVIGWTNPTTLGLGAVALIVGALFIVAETRARNPFVNFALFRNATYTGATISNFMLNGVAGMLLVSMMLLQVGGGMSAQTAGMLTLGYAIAIVAFIRVGEKLLQRFGARKPMIWGSLIVGLSIAMLMPTKLLLRQYKHSRGRVVHALRSGSRLLRHPVDRCRAVQSARRSGWIGIRPLQDGVVARRVIRRRDLRGNLHRAQRGQRINAVAGGHADVRRTSGQRRSPASGVDCAGVQSPHGRGRRPVHRPDDTQRPHACSPAIGARRPNQAGHGRAQSSAARERC